MNPTLRLVAVVMLAAGCTIQTTSSDPPAQRFCAPGASTGCTCDSGKAGSQTCNAEGTAFDACMCACVPNCTSKKCGDDGCGGTCGTCEDGFACSTASTCKVDPEGLWSVMVTKGKVPSDSSANYLSLPDPFVCIQPTGASKVCTGSKTDTAEPIWNEVVLTKAKASILVLPIATSVWDDDDPTDPHDVLCSKTITLTDSDFAAGSFAVSCSGHTFEAKLIPEAK